MAAATGRVQETTAHPFQVFSESRRSSVYRPFGWEERGIRICRAAVDDWACRSDDGEVRVRFVGSGDAFGSGGRWQTCIHLESGGQNLLVDCGATTLVALKAQGIDPSAIDTVAITHLHGDHFGGLPWLILDGQFAHRTSRLHVLRPAGTAARLAQAMEVLFPGSSGWLADSPLMSRNLSPVGRPSRRAR